ncbi:hypothetical protein M231_01277 [Tremella mesenterica]|uniref:Cns1/TTC4 wheel domain-containing protein n=1 Tax=Tremella mesenterica TaxID=5217 RepID=A0A4Q1BTU0_TREME|nr:hypothetical protein M231_01277 [Tremella mesenterica]
MAVVTSIDPAHKSRQTTTNSGPCFGTMETHGTSREGTETSETMGPIKKKETTWKDFEAMLESTPLFMNHTPVEGEENEVLEALRTLKFEGNGDEVALNLKDHGNELHSQKSYSKAIEAYTQGLDAGPTDISLRISLLNNRAACNLLLKNHGSVIRDIGVIIALCVKNGLSVPAKSMYRAGQSLIALERWEEGRDCVNRGKRLSGQGEEEMKKWDKLGEEIEKGIRRMNEKIERLRKEREDKLELRKAILERGLVIIDTPNPPDNPHPVHFETPSSSSSEQTPRSLIFPVFLLYPQHTQSDLITHFHEETTFEDQLSAMFPPSLTAQSGWVPWDEKHEYWYGNLVIYLETAQKRLLKIGKGLSLRQTLSNAIKEDEKVKGGKDGIVLRDGLLSFVVLPKGEREKEWVERFKKTRDKR